jgi:hypothetical protein
MNNWEMPWRFPADQNKVPLEVLKTGQSAGFQSLRMRTFKVMGYCSLNRKTNFFRVLNPQNVIIKRLRSKAFSPSCLFRF